MKRQSLKSFCVTLLVCVILLTQMLCFTSCANNEHNDNNNSNTNPKENENTLSNGETEQINQNESETTVEKFIVRFITDEGIPISITECKRGEALLPPTPPRRIGYVFTGWNGNYNNITQNTDVIANYTDISKNQNVISADTIYVAGTSEFNVLIGIYGNVNFCGLDMDITYDSDLFEYVNSADVDNCVILNGATKGVIHMNYVTTNNTTGEVSFMTLKFKSKASTKTEANLKININSMYSLDNTNALAPSEYQVLQNKIIIEEAHDEQ